MTGAWTWIRRGLAALVLIAAAALVLGSHYFNELEVCETVTKQGVIERSCGAYPFAEVVPLLLIALILLWPDLSEFELAGVLRVVRRIDEQQGQLQQGQERLERQMTQIQIVSQSQRFEPTLNVYNDLSRAAREKEGAAGESVTAAQTADDSELRRLFDDAWSQLEPWSNLAVRLRDREFVKALLGAAGDNGPWSEAPGLSPGDRQLLEELQLPSGASVDDLVDWSTEAHPQLENVRQIRSLGDQVPESVMRDAIVVAEGVLGEIASRGWRTSD